MMSQSYDIHMNASEMHSRPIARTAGQGKHLDACRRPRQDMPAPAHASLPQEMHAPQSLPGARIICTPQLKVYRPPNCTLINHYSIPMLQSAQEMTPCTKTIDPGTCNGLGARISQAQRCTRRAHACHGASASGLTEMHAYSMLHAPVGVILACYHQTHLLFGVPLP